MSEAGYIAVHRSIWDHERFANQTFSEREAWIWLVSTAVWKDCRVRSGSVMVELKRGELLFSTRFLAKKWKWSQSKVMRFLTMLEIDSMIGSLTKHNSTHITICNYSKYQLDASTDGSQSGSLNGSVVVQSWFKEEEGNKLIKENTRAKALVYEGDWPKEYCDLFWQLFPKRTDKQVAFKKLDQIRRGGKVPWATLIGGVKRYAESVRGKDQQFTKGPAAWLNAGKWDDEIKTGGFHSNRLEGIL